MLKVSSYLVAGRTSSAIMTGQYARLLFLKYEAQVNPAKKNKKRITGTLWFNEM
jgi:hypothetical protein